MGENVEVKQKPKFFSKQYFKQFFTKERFKMMFTKPGAFSFYSSLICIVAALLLGLIILLCMNPELAFPDFGVMITGNLFGGVNALKNVKTFFSILAKTAPLICCGLAIIFAQKSGMFNIGVAGQYLMGMFGALLFALQVKAPWFVCVMFALIFGAIWGAIPGLLKSFFNVNEVISGIMLNWIGLFFVNYSFQTYLNGCVDLQKGAKTYSVTQFNPSAKLPNFGLSDTLGNSFSIAILIAILLAILCWFIISKTTLGYQLRASGFNKDASKYAGMNEKASIIISLAVSGALAGVGAALYFLADIEQWSVQLSQSLPSMPWNGITVAFIAQGNPIACIISSLFVTFLFHGSTFMTQTAFPFEISNLITGIIVYFCGFSSFIVGILVKYRGHYKELFSKIGHNIVNGCKNIWIKVSAFFKKLWHKIKSLFNKNKEMETTTSIQNDETDIKIEKQNSDSIDEVDEQKGGL